MFLKDTPGCYMGNEVLINYQGNFEDEEASVNKYSGPGYKVSLSYQTRQEFTYLCLGGKSEGTLEAKSRQR